MRRRDFCATGLGALTSAAISQHSVRASTFSSEVPAVRLDGRQIILKAGDIADLKASLRGEVITAGQAGYNSARRIWNGAFDRKPALVVRCSGAADVRRAVRFASGHGLLTAVRAGGHSFSGWSSCDGGLVIDVAPMRDVRADPLAKVVHVGSGTLIGAVDRQTQTFGLATPLGDAPDTGVAGLTLGGGLGWLRCRFGLSADNLLEAGVVTANGDWLQASSAQNSDLFWALKGGGGNFGVVTSLAYRLHDVPSLMFGGSLTFPFAHSRRLLRSYAEICTKAPDELSLGVDLSRDEEGARVVGFSVCYSGPLANAERMVAPLRKLGKPLTDNLGPTTYLKLQGSSDVLPEVRRGAYVRGGLVDELSPSFADALVDYVEANPIHDFDIELFNLGGAISRVAPRDSAYWARSAAHALLLWGEWKIPGDGSERNTDWVRGLWTRLEPYAKGYYANFSSTDDPESRIRAGYGGNYARLADIKRRYDPENMFRLNANIKPAS